jgi:hypothetical protein
VNANICNLQKVGSGGTYYVDSSKLGNTGSASSTVTFNCPYIDDTNNPKQSNTVLYVDVQNLNTSGYYPTAEACVYSFTGAGSSCGALNMTGTSSGWNSLSLDLSAWTNSSYSSWYPVVVVNTVGSTYVQGFLADD